jgi:SAM-dependent methyltransferase
MDIRAGKRYKDKDNHPAKFSDILLPIFSKELQGYNKILDPFAGTGKLRLVRPDAFLLEIEPEWAMCSGATVGDALALPWKNGVFDAVCTSPTYGNRMADHFTDHQKNKNYTRNTYRHALGRPLSANNSGRMQWGDNYRDFHKKAWVEVWRVLRPGGKFVLNVSDHIRKGVVQEVTRTKSGAACELRKRDDFLKAC